MLLSALLLLFGGVYAFHYELDGHFTEIAVRDVHAAPTSRGHFLPAEDKLRRRLNALFDGQLDDFFIQSFSIHGEDLHPSAIYTAYLSTPLSRSEILVHVSQAPDVEFFRLRQVEALPPAPSTSANDAAVDSCYNGGFLLPNSSCACPAFFSGDMCEVVNCLNGGIADRARCACPPGRYAVNCEQRGCLPSVQANTKIGKPSFILVVNQKSSMAYVLDQLASHLGGVLEGFFASSVFENFLVVNYVRTKNVMIMTPSTFDNVQDMLDYLNTLVYTVQGLPKQPTQRAVLLAQSFYPFMQPLSNIFVFFDSLDEDAGPQNYILASTAVEDRLVLQTLAWRNRIVYLFSEAKGVDHSAAGDGYDTFQRVAAATLGDVYTYLQNDIDQTVNIISIYTITESLAAVYGLTNTINFDLKIPVDPNGGNVYVLVAVPSGEKPKVTDGNRNNMPHFVNTTRYTIYETTSDNKMVIVHAGGKKVNVRSWVSSKETMFLAAAYDPKVDGGTNYLSASFDNTINGLPTTDALPAFATLQFLDLENQKILSNEAVAEPVTTECTYTMQFSVMAKCTAGPVGQLVAITSNAGYTFNRLLPGVCLASDRKPATMFVCHNGGTRNGLKNCRCTDEWTGPDCTTPICLNGGTVNPFTGNGHGPCNCAPGFSGDHCGQLICTTPPASPLPSGNTTLAIVLQSSASQSGISASIDEGINTLLKSMTGKDSYDQFVLTSYAYQLYGGVRHDIINTTTYTDPVLFQRGISNVRYLPSTSDMQDSLTALQSTLQSSQFDNAALFLFTDAPINTNSGQSLPTIVQTAVERGIQINVVITPPFGMMEQCKFTTSLHQELAFKTGGIFLNLCNPTSREYVDPIHSLFASYAASHHRTEVLNELEFTTMKEGVAMIFYVDQPGNDVFLVVNCPTDEAFTTRITNYDLGVPQDLVPIAVMPFLAVYKVSTTQVNFNGYEAETTKSFNSNDSVCDVKALMKSKHAAYLRFSSNPSLDAERSNITFAVPSYPVIHVNEQLNRTYQPTLSATDDKTVTFYYTAYPQLRDSSCTFEYYTLQAFTCSKPSDSFILRFAGATNDGHHYRRALRAFCYLPDGQCANGGYKLSNGICKCPPDFNGLYCQTPKCRNGFPLNVQTFTCDCTGKYTGQFCEIPVCDNWNYLESVDPRNTAPRQMTFVLNNNADNLLVNVQLSNIIKTVVTASQGGPVPVMYSLITFDQYDVQRLISTSHADQFITAFQAAVNNYQKYTFSTSRSIDALVDAWKLNIQAPGIIYLFTGQPAETPSYSAFDNFLEQKINTQVNVFYTPQNGGSYPRVPTDVVTSQLTLAVKQSGGRFYPLSQNSISSMAPVFFSATQSKELVADVGLDDCTTMCNMVFSLESSFRTVEISLVGIDISTPGYVTVIDGQGRTVPITQRNTLFSDNQVLILSFDSSMASSGPTAWAVRVKTTYGGAEMQVRVDSDFRLYPGFTISMFDDFVHQIPFTGLGLNRSTYMTFHLVDSQNNVDSSAVLDKVFISRTNFAKPSIEGTEVDELLITKRDTASCAYQYVSAEWNVDLSTQQKFMVTGLDSKGVQFQRTFFYQFPQFNQRQATCLHGTHDSYGQCICTDPTKWTGDYCQTPVCQNGGTGSYGICICPDGYYGLNCEINVTD